MNRRQFFAGATGCLTCLAGCTGFESLGSDDRHVFAESTVSVRVENRGATDHDVRTNAQEVLDFWAAESSQYTGFGIGFEIVDENPDIIMAYVDTVERCSGVTNNSSTVLGCAPLIKPGNRITRPATARVVAADRPIGSVRTTAKHEIGHILGLGHDDEPRQIMSNRPKDRIPLYEIRVEIWETVVGGYEQSATAAQQLNTAIGAWNQQRYQTATTAFENAETAYVAARNGFQTARDRTVDLDTEPPLETVDLPTLTEDLDRVVNRMAAAVDVATTMAEASRAAADGDRSTSRRLSSTANDRLAEFRAIDAPPSREFAVALGLVRGTNREDTDVTVANETL